MSIAPPRIITKSGTVFEGLEGDVALRIPCEVVGVPKPAITWKFKGAIITSSKLIVYLLLLINHFT